MRILLIEDEHKIARALKKALEQESYAVDVAYDGDEGYAMATTEPYDAAIIDRMLPGSYDGIAIVKAMREEKIHTPVLILTALGGINDRTTGLDSGADDYLVKPFALEELLARVRALLRRPVEQQATILSAGDLTLNTITYEVQRAGETIQLTGKEFALLEYLLRNQNRPLPKELIISHVWDYDANILPNTVEVYIKYLRNKIDDPFDTPLIQTVRGFGYRLHTVTAGK
jgi:DNA-binding response OmpR family regulator